MGNAYRISMEKLERMRTLGKSRLEDNIKVVLNGVLRVWTGLLWFRISSSGVLLSARQ
jgi:hypothetical protein